MGNAECGQREERACCVTAEVTVEDQRISWIFKFFEGLVLLDGVFCSTYRSTVLPFYRSTVLPFYRSTVLAAKDLPYRRGSSSHGDHAHREVSGMLISPAAS